MSHMVVSITLNGHDEEFDLGEIMSISNPEADRETVAAQMAWWGAIWGQAVETEQLADAAYRSWRARTTDKVAANGTAEWKSKNIVEGMPEFVTHKEQIAAAARNAATARAIYEAYGKKAELLIKLVRRDDNDSYHGRTLGREHNNEEAREEREDRARAAIAATKQRKGKGA